MENPIDQNNYTVPPKPEEFDHEHETKSYRKLIIIGSAVLLILIISAASWLFLAKDDNAANVTTPPTPVSPTPPPAAAEGEQEWLLFQRAITFAKNHDIAGLNSISIKQLTAADCPVPQECYALLDYFHTEFSAVKRQDLVNLSISEKQSVLSTNAVSKTTNGSQELVKTYLMFKKSGNDLKVLSFKQKRTADQKGGSENTFTDSDNDGLTDEEETCEGAEKFNPKCIKTDPLNKDTDGDGWWDGIEFAGGFNPNGAGTL